MSIGSNVLKCFLLLIIVCSVRTEGYAGKDHATHVEKNRNAGKLEDGRGTMFLYEKESQSYDNSKDDEEGEEKRMVMQDENEGGEQLVGKKERFNAAPEITWRVGKELKESLKDTGRREARGVGYTQKEDLVKQETLKLVKWLRNRLRSRLKDVAAIERETATSQKFILSLKRKALETGKERMKEIQWKKETERKLASFRKAILDPSEKLKGIKKEELKVEDELDALARDYDRLGKVYAGLRRKIEEAGLTHWLESRGKEQFAATTLGILSKSKEILDPVVVGIQSAVNLDAKIVKEFESLIPLPESPLMSSVTTDIIILIPVITIIAGIYRIYSSVHALSVFHHTLFLSCVMGLQATACLAISLLLQEDALHVFQQKREHLFMFFSL